MVLAFFILHTNISNTMYIFTTLYITAIPADCRVNSSEIDVDQAALTGESLPVTFYKGDSCKMGSTVVRGEVNATVEFTGSDTFFGKTASLLAETNEHSHLQKILMQIMFILVGLSVTLCLINFIYLMSEGESLKESLSHVSQEQHILYHIHFISCVQRSNLGTL